MNKLVEIVECPRDAWQGLSSQIPTERKAAYLRKLIAAGFTHIDAVSFVSSRAVPQMADSEQVMQLLNPPDHVEIIGIVANRRGAERAVACPGVTTLGFPYSISPAFLRRNQNQSPEDALEELSQISQLAHANGRNVVVYISMAFGNPYGDAWDAQSVIEGCEQLAVLGISTVSLADTVGLANSHQISEIVSATHAALPSIYFGVHLHARREQAAERLRAAFNAGCRRFDAALAGLGGCPFAQDDLVGNIPTEILLEELRAGGATFAPIGPLDELLRDSKELSASPHP